MTDIDPDGRDGLAEQYDEPVANVVRPYTLTAGRTTSQVDVPMEATVELTSAGQDRRWPPHEPSSRIAGLCAAERLSVAEIAARAGLALGVTRVLVGDLVTHGYAQLQKTLTDSTPSVERISLIERTLRGLRDL
ncbi:MAG TPA: DUF742 domain-containing protein [Flexivirga sp.]|uniref:DUF742 domain-containing protein n=1 Tax=Flexivirga sp. TaxID=1962927 RepID=UPI002B9A2BB3|nr:DUF742 domain-containing protein [Flexivirga sp.]HWC24222.1 DUF742 domain-containing protein [Flexivirga sp.]